MPSIPFQPHPLARNPHIQTLLSRHRPDAQAVQQAAREHIIQVEDGIRLQGFYSPHEQPKGMVLLLHGWLGCAQSNYVLTIAEHLYQQGHSIFRLNFRDHGETSALNPGVFRSDLLDEVFDATQQVAQIEPHLPFYLVGASLGGNFALRVLWRHTLSPIPNLAHVVAINPAINPHRAAIAIDTGFPLYRVYFRQRWRNSLLEKQHRFPDLYDFSWIASAATCLEMTERFVRPYSPYADALSYFDAYTVTPTMLAASQTQATILTTADDPIIPVIDFAPFIGLSPHLTVTIVPHGGHVGYMDLWPLRSWLGEAVGARLGSNNRV